jgi:hypothetical protein
MTTSKILFYFIFLCLHCRISVAQTRKFCKNYETLQLDSIVLSDFISVKTITESINLGIKENHSGKIPFSYAFSHDGKYLYFFDNKNLHKICTKTKKRLKTINIISSVPIGNIIGYVILSKDKIGILWGNINDNTFQNSNYGQFSFSYMDSSLTNMKKVSFLNNRYCLQFENQDYIFKNFEMDNDGIILHSVSNSFMISKGKLHSLPNESFYLSNELDVVTNSKYAIDIQKMSIKNTINNNKVSINIIDSIRAINFINNNRVFFTPINKKTLF